MLLKLTVDFYFLSVATRKFKITHMVPHLWPSLYFYWTGLVQISEMQPTVIVKIT